MKLIINKHIPELRLPTIEIAIGSSFSVIPDCFFCSGGFIIKFLWLRVEADWSIIGYRFRKGFSRKEWADLIDDKAAGKEDLYNALHIKQWGEEDKCWLREKLKQLDSSELLKFIAKELRDEDMRTAFKEILKEKL